MFEDVEHPDEIESDSRLKRRLTDIALDERSAGSFAGEPEALNLEIHAKDCATGADLVQYPQRVAGAAPDFEHSVPNGKSWFDAGRERPNQCIAGREPEVPILGRAEMRNVASIEAASSPGHLLMR